MKHVLLVGVGGFLGAVSRYSISSLVHRASATNFPIGTLAVNAVGCLLIGVVVGWLDHKGGPSREVWSFLIVGLLGGFTTFSAFGLETLVLLRDGHWVLSVLNIVVQVVVGIGFAAGGFFLSRTH